MCKKLNIQNQIMFEQTYQFKWEFEIDCYNTICGSDTFINSFILFSLSRAVKTHYIEVEVQGFLNI